MPEELDPFDAAASEAETELSTDTAVEQAPDTSDTPIATETAAEVPTAVQEPSGDAAVTPPPAPPAQANWWDEHLDSTIEYGGQTLTLKEALGGGLRQADYTRKTQELAQKQRVADWGMETLQGLRDDPVETLRKLAADAGLIPKDQQQFDPQEEPDPALVELSQFRQQYESEMSELQQARRVEEARKEIAAARAAHPDFSDDVLKLVYDMYDQHGIGLTIEQGYAMWRGQQALTQDAARKQAASAAEQHAATLEAARAAAQVAGGHSGTSLLTEEKDYGGAKGGELFDLIAEDVWGSLEDDEG